MLTNESLVQVHKPIEAGSKLDMFRLLFDHVDGDVPPKRQPLSELYDTETCTTVFLILTVNIIKTCLSFHS
jgi:hypothetical protein